MKCALILSVLLLAACGIREVPQSYKDTVKALGIAAVWPSHWAKPCAESYLFVTADGRDGIACNNGAVFVRWYPEVPNAR